MVTITRHVSIDIFQMEHNSGVKYDTGMACVIILWYQNLQKFEKKMKNRTGLL